MAAPPTLTKADFDNVTKSNLDPTTMDKVLKLMKMNYVDTSVHKFVLYLGAPGMKGALREHVVREVETAVGPNIYKDVVLERDDVSAVPDGMTLIYVFDHNAGRFQNALGLKTQFMPVYAAKKWKKVIIIEFGVGDAATARNNPPEISKFDIPDIAPRTQIPVVKFWYDIDFKMTAKTENDESRTKLKNILGPMLIGKRLSVPIRFGNEFGRYCLMADAADHLRVFDKHTNAFTCNHTYKNATDYINKDKSSKSTHVCPDCDQ